MWVGYTSHTHTTHKYIHVQTHTRTHTCAQYDRESFQMLCTEQDSCLELGLQLIIGLNMTMSMFCGLYAYAWDNKSVNL